MVLNIYFLSSFLSKSDGGTRFMCLRFFSIKKATLNKNISVLFKQIKCLKCLS